MTRDEVQAILSLMEGEAGLLARLLYGTGMRRNEALSLRVKDLDFERHAIVVREAKGGKDRVVMLPNTLIQPMHEQLARSRTLWAADRAARRAGVSMPHALEAMNLSIGERDDWLQFSDHMPITFSVRN